KQLGPDFFDALLHLVNIEQDEIKPKHGDITPAWWKEAVFYQIYPRSFYDTNDDGIGDLRGIIEKLDYLKDLGINALWLSPIYDSPNDDNGYDIRDYQQIMKEFGTMEDFDELLSEVHKRDMKLIMDLVVNHTSDEHEWFKKALNEPESKYRNYYHFKKDDGTKTFPNNWTSFFSGPAWNYYEEQNLWGLHLFSKKQMDLNWDNPEVREEIIQMINWWLDKGVDGFRMDVINYISKEEGLPQGNQLIGDLMGYPGIERYYYGPNLHKYLKEIHDKAFKPHNAFSVGETPGLGMKMAQLVTAEERGELDMVFSFDHLETPGHVRMEDYKYDLNYYRDYMIEWMENYGDNCWMSIFYNNHDNPRMISKITDKKEHHQNLAILLAVMQMTMKGTPFIFQGDEMGLVNYDFTSMDQITDVEAKGYYDEQIQKKSHDEVFKILLAGTREHTRILLPWNKTLPAWHQGLLQKANPKVTEVYQKLIQLRHSDQSLVYGDFKVLNKKKNHFTYTRDDKYLIDCNLSEQNEKAFSVSKEWQLIYPKIVDKNTMKSYEARIYNKS
ncbi:MAG: alpha-glucosidase, partial [Erysipelotrichaceae bacterium]|nr:alpha-glucosidase [Erysipelotrichaceae bacterium]